MIKGYVRYCDRCGVELTKANNTCGFELCDKCNEALEQQLAIKNDLGVDLISRKQAIEEADKLTLETGYDNEKVEEMLRDLPSVTPQLSVPEVTALAEWTTKLTEANKSAYSQGYAAGKKAQEPRKGYWLRRPHVYGVTYCSVCDFELRIDNTNYCPNCGARMAETEAEDGNVDN